MERKIIKLFKKDLMKSHEIGGREERRVFRLLQTKKVPDWFIGCWLTEPNDLDDQNGIDMWVKTIAGYIPLQIKLLGKKSKNRGRNKNYYYEKGIGFITTHWDGFNKKNDDELFKETIKEIEQLFNSLVNLIRVCYSDFTNK